MIKEREATLDAQSEEEEKLISQIELDEVRIPSRQRAYVDSLAKAHTGETKQARRGWPEFIPTEIAVRVAKEQC